MNHVNEEKLLHDLFELDDIDTNIDVPNKLKDKLYHVSRRQAMPHFWQKSSAIAACSVLTVALALFVKTQNEYYGIEQGKRDLITAFEYIELSHQQLDDEFASAISDGLPENIDSGTTEESLIDFLEEMPL